jgi:4-alpha-glucanotransferase
MLVNLEDLWAETKSQNLPGTSQDKPNWRRKAKFTIHEMLLHSDFREVLTKVNNLRTVKQKAEG